MTLVDRIADVLRQYFDNAYDYEGNEFHPDISCLADDIAAVVRPRIDSIEQLDALPDGSVVRAREGAIFEKVTLYTGPGEPWWRSGSDVECATTQISLPATLLYTTGDTE